MPFVIGSIMVMILFILLISIYVESLFSDTRPYFRLIHVGEKYVIQYRKALFFWRTYTLINTGEPAVYYVKSEAEAMIKTLAERRKQTNDLNKTRTNKVKIYRYDTNGNQVNK